MTTEDLQFYYAKATDAKSQVLSVYNEVLEYTDLTYEIQDSETKDFAPAEIDSIIPRQLDNLTSFLMTSMFSRSDKWASLKMNEKLYKLVNASEEDYLVGTTIDKLNKDLENASDVTFTYLNQSNYYTEIAKALREAVNLGVGCYRISETPDAYTPFYFQYVPLDDLFFWCDARNKPVYIFKILRDMSQTAIRLMFGDECKIPSSLANPEQDAMSLMEVVYPHPDEPNRFMYSIMTEDFSETFMEKELEYCPITIFRWRVEGSNPWGLGLSVEGLKCFKELKEMKEKRTASADKLLEPPLWLKGDKSLASQVSLEAGSVNYGGTATATGIGLASDIYIEPIQTVGTLLPLDQDIASKEAEIRQLYLANPLGDIADTTRRTKTEVEMRLTSLRQRWGLSYELLSQELLTPAFTTPLKILIAQKKIEFEMGDLDSTMINYKNALSLSQDMQSVEMVLLYMQNAQVVAQNGEMVGLNSTATLDYFKDSLGIPQALRLTKEENEALRQQLQQQSQMIAQQRQMQEMQNAGNETSPEMMGM